VAAAAAAVAPVAAATAQTTQPTSKPMIDRELMMKIQFIELELAALATMRARGRRSQCGAQAERQERSAWQVNGKLEKGEAGGQNINYLWPPMIKFTASEREVCTSTGCHQRANPLPSPRGLRAHDCQYLLGRPVGRARLSA